MSIKINCISSFQNKYPKEQYVLYRNKLTLLIRQSKINYYTMAFAENAKNSKIAWKLINNLTGKNKTNVSMPMPNLDVNEINRFFLNLVLKLLIIYRMFQILKLLFQLFLLPLSTIILTLQKLSKLPSYCLILILVVLMDFLVLYLKKLLTVLVSHYQKSLINLSLKVLYQVNKKLQK